ncbi:MAG: hypothetical protein K0U72_16960 [Gammaproteobacteria bacterium]|nr:hypothetical protein [Gammaproteobacteria bacterium]
MKLPRLRTILLVPVVLFALFYLTMLVVVLLDDRVAEPLDDSEIDPITVAIFGGSGTAGDGILKAALASSDIEKIHVVTRRLTPRMEQGIADGKLEVSVHMDYLDYSAVINELVDVDAVYWALGISSLGVDEETYGMIHVDFPVQFVTAWQSVSKKPEYSFHYVSSSDISEESSAMWAREKVRAENALFKLAEGSNLRVIAYRPDYIGPTSEEAHIGQDLLYWFFAPVKSAVRATKIGQAMIEVSFRPVEFKNGDKLYTGKTIRYSEAYEARQAQNHEDK